MKTELKTITPEWAEEVLKSNNVNNRTLRQGFINKVARDIKSGAFATTHQGIAFYTNGNLADGQHRLCSIVLAKKPVQMYVTTDLPLTHKSNGVAINTFELIDTGAARNSGTMLQLAGFENANRLAACIRALIIVASKAGSFAVSTAQIHKAIHLIGDSAERCVHLAQTNRMFIVPAYIVAACTFYHTVKQTEAEKFLIEVGSIVGPAKGPSRALVMWCKNHPMTGGTTKWSGFKVAATCIQSFDTGRPVTKAYASDASLEWLLSLNEPLLAGLAKISQL